MGSDEWCPVQRHTGDAIRPGGLELTDRALAFCSLPPGSWVLDVGCGPGATLGYLIDHELVAVGLDTCALFLRAARQCHVQPALAQAEGERLPLAGRTVDAVLAECSLSALGSADWALAEFVRVLKPGGKLVVSDLYLRRPEGVDALRRLPLAGCLARAWTRQELADRLHALGLHLLLWEDRSADLKRLTAQLILAGGRLEELWCPAGSADARPDPTEMKWTISAAGPGYFLLVAERWSLV